MKNCSLLAIVDGVLMFLQTWRWQESAETVTTNSMTYSVMSPVDPNGGGDCSPCSRTGGAPATSTSSLLCRFQQEKIQEMRNNEG